MIDNKWFCEPNDLRESWCFLSLDVGGWNEGSVITSWEIGYANPAKLIRKINCDESSENKVIGKLLNEIFYCRKNGIKIITYGNNVVPALRTRILVLGLAEVGLHGMDLICIEDLLSKFFLFDDNSLTGGPTSGVLKKIGVADGSGAELLWRLFQKICPLIPGGVF